MLWWQIENEEMMNPLAELLRSILTEPELTRPATIEMEETAPNYFEQKTSDKNEQRDSTQISS